MSRILIKILIFKAFILTYVSQFLLTPASCFHSQRRSQGETIKECMTI